VTLKEALGHARKTLTASKIEDTPLECELLLRYTLKISRTQLYLDPNRELSLQEEVTFRRLIKRRLEGEPTAYITKYREFYGLNFYVDNRVLIPRPESETLVEKALDRVQSCPVATIAEIGTGCGAIAVSLALNLPDVKIYATDISSPALEVAGKNCRRHEVSDKVCLLQGDMLEPLPEPVDIIVANLPYVKLSDIDDRCPEPLLALDGGADGLEKIKHLIHQVEGDSSGRKLFF